MESHLFMSIITMSNSIRPFVVFKQRNEPSHATSIHWDGSNQCMATKLEGDDYHPKCGTFFQITSIDFNPPPGTSETSHSFPSRKNFKYYNRCSPLLPHLYTFVNKHRMPSHFPNNLLKKFAPS